MSSADEKSVDGEVVESEEEEKENYMFIILFYFLGTACFIPNSFFVTANKYWMYKFRDTSLPHDEAANPEKTTLQKNFTAYSTITGNIGTTLFLVLTVLLRNKIQLQTRIIGSLFLMVAFLALTLIFIFIDTDTWQEEFFVVVLLISAVLHCGTSVLVVSVCQLALKFRPRCLAAQFAGQSVCGIFGAALQVLTLLVASSIELTTALFYSVAIGAMGGTLIGYVIVLKRSRSFQKQLRSEDKDPNALDGKPKITFAVVKSVFWKMRFFIASLAVGVGATLMLHPGLTILMESSQKGANAWGNTYFLPVCVFLFYNIFEFVGREASNLFMKFNNIKIILVGSVIRLAIFPLILLCNLQPRNNMPVVFYDDGFFIVFMITLSFSNGYLLNVSLVKYTEACEPEEKYMGGAIITLVMLVLTPIFVFLSGVLVNLV